MRQWRRRGNGESERCGGRRERGLGLERGFGEWRKGTRGRDESERSRRVMRVEEWLR